MTTEASGFFRPGGTLPLGAPSYVARSADRELVDALAAHEYCYVLNSRQMGKSSLCVRAMTALAERGHRVAFLDLTKIGGRNLTPEQWYVGMLREIGRGLGLGSELVASYKADPDLPPMQRFFGAIREVGVARSEGPVTILIDEIDATRALPFSADEFFAGIRECHNRRVHDAEYGRLTFCLIGVATPSDLIRDPMTTPFNIGRRIELRDFTPEEAAPLAGGLGPDGAKRLSRVLYWTGGHPYLTQAVCAEAAAHPDEKVDRIVERMFFHAKARETNVNLADVQNRLLGVTAAAMSPEEHRAAVLDLYDRIRGRRKTVRDDETDPLVALLKLCGLARVLDGYLWVRNRIYFRVFDREWLRGNLPDAEIARQKRAAFVATMRTAAVGGTIVMAMGALLFSNTRLNREVTAALGRARAAAKEARANGEVASANAARAETARGIAQSNLLRAEAGEKAARRNLVRATASEAVAKKSLALSEQRAREVRAANAGLVRQTAVALAARREEGRARGIAVRALAGERRVSGELTSELGYSQLVRAFRLAFEGDRQASQALLPGGGDPGSRNFAENLTRSYVTPVLSAKEAEITGNSLVRLIDGYQYIGSWQMWRVDDSMEACADAEGRTFYLATARGVEAWDVESGTRRLVRPGRYHTVVQSPSRKRTVGIGLRFDRTRQILEIETVDLASGQKGRYRTPTRPEHGWISAFDVSDDGSTLAMGVGKRVVMWSEGRSQSWEMTGQEANATSLSFLAGSRTLLVGKADNENVTLEFGAEAARPVGKFGAYVNVDPVTSDLVIVSGRDTGSLVDPKSFTAQSGFSTGVDPIRRITLMHEPRVGVRLGVTEMFGDYKEVDVVSWPKSLERPTFPRGNSLVVLTTTKGTLHYGGGIAKLYRTPSWRHREDVPFWLAFSPDSKTLITVPRAGPMLEKGSAVISYDTETRQMITRTHDMVVNVGPVATKLMPKPETVIGYDRRTGALLMTEFDEGKINGKTIYVRDGRTFRLIRSVKLERPIDRTALERNHLNSNYDQPSPIEISPDGRWLVWTNGQMRGSALGHIVDLKTGKEVKRVPGMQSPMVLRSLTSAVTRTGPVSGTSLIVPPGVRKAWLARYAGPTRIIRTTDDEIAVLSDDRASIVRPDGTIRWTLSDLGGKVQFFDTNRKAGIAFAQSARGGLRLYSLANRKLLGSIPIDRGAVAVAISPNGRYIAFSDEDDVTVYDSLAYVNPPRKGR